MQWKEEHVCGRKMLLVANATGRFGESEAKRHTRWFSLAALIVFGALSSGCASYQGTSTTVHPSAVVSEGDWILVPNFPLVLQEKSDDCGAAVLASVLRFWGYAATPGSISARLGRTDNRLKAGDMATYARSRGLKAYVFFGTMQDIEHELARGRPVIVGLGKMVGETKALSHYEVVVGYEPTKKQLLLLDPDRGWQTDSLAGFKKEWALTKAVTIVAFLPDSDRSVVRR